MDNFNVVIHHMAVPRLQFTRIWITSKITKVTNPCPSHFIVNLESSFNEMLVSISLSFLLMLCLVAGISIWSMWSGVEGSSSSILVSLLSDMLRVSRSDFSKFWRASGVEGATGAAAKEASKVIGRG